ncbi:hypothetical protein D6C98_10160 [Aureobasidium pullulans]|nr:hypothetical protein D6C98_10160 [Aureobasidium pullulans]
MRVEYTFTDLAPSFVAAARKRFSQYDFIKYRTYDIEHSAPEDLRNSQHIVIASNAIHATHNITKSASHVKEFLRSNRLLLMKRHLLAAGYGSVDWTDGERPENKLEKLIIATVMPSPNSPTNTAAPDGTVMQAPATFEARAAAIEHYVQRMAHRFSCLAPALS